MTEFNRADIIEALVKIEDHAMRAAFIEQANALFTDSMKEKERARIIQALCSIKDKGGLAAFVDQAQKLFRYSMMGGPQHTMIDQALSKIIDKRGTRYSTVNPEIKSQLESLLNDWRAGSDGEQLMRDLVAMQDQYKSKSLNIIAALKRIEKLMSEFNRAEFNRADIIEALVEIEDHAMRESVADQAQKLIKDWMDGSCRVEIIRHIYKRELSQITS